MIKFGQSTRDWLLGGPQELMPEEGPSKAQRLEARLTKVCELLVSNRRIVRRACRRDVRVLPEQGPMVCSAQKVAC